MTDDQEKMVDEIMDNEDAGLCGSEIDFIEDLDSNRKINLFEKQEAWLTKIWNRVFK